MIDENFFTKFKANNFYNNYTEEELIKKIEKLNNDISRLSIISDFFKKLEKFDYGDIFIITIIASIFILGNSLFSIGLFISLSAIKGISMISYRYCKKKLNCKKDEEKAINKAIEKYEIDKEKSINSKNNTKLKKSLLEQIDKLDKKQLLAIRTVITEYTTNKDIPSQVANIAQFLTETQVTDIDIKDTSLYNEVRGKARSYSIDHSKQN